MAAGFVKIKLLSGLNFGRTMLSLLGKSRHTKGHRWTRAAKVILILASKMADYIKINVPSPPLYRCKRYLAYYHTCYLVHLRAQIYLPYFVAINCFLFYHHITKHVWNVSYKAIFQHISMFLCIRLFSSHTEWFQLKFHIYKVVKNEPLVTCL